MFDHNTEMLKFPMWRQEVGMKQKQEMNHEDCSPGEVGERDRERGKQEDASLGWVQEESERE